MFSQRHTLLRELEKREYRRVDQIKTPFIKGEDKENAEAENDIQIEIVHLKQLLAFLDEQFRIVEQKVDSLLLSNKTSYDLLWHLFPIDSDVSFTERNSELICAGRVLFE